MFGFLSSLLGRSLSTNIVELAVQLILFYSIYKLGDTKSKIWRVICQRLSFFLILETFVQFLASLNSLYFFITIPILFKIGILALIAIPLFKLWIEMPKLLLAYNQENITSKLSVTERTNIINQNKSRPIIDFEVNKRLLNSLKRIDKAA